MSRILYCLAQTVRSIRRAPLVNLLAVGTLAATLSILGAFLLLYHNVVPVLRAWEREAAVTVYVRDDVPPGRVLEILRRLEQIPGAASVTYYDRKRALERLAREWPDRVAALGPEVVEAYLEVAPAPGASRSALAEAIRAALADVASLAEIDAAEEEVDRVGLAVGTLRTIGIAVGGLIALAALFIAGATVRLVVLRRRDEIEILRLVGATAWYIRLPLCLEGALQGGVAAALALGILAGVLRVGETAILQVVPLGFLSASAAMELAFLPRDQMAYFVAGAGALCALGSAISAGRRMS